MAKGFVVATAWGTKLENYSGTLAEAECATDVCSQVFETAFKISQAGFLEPAEVRYNFPHREIKLVLDGGNYVHLEILLQAGVDAQAATRLVLRELVFPVFQQQAAIAG